MYQLDNLVSLAVATSGEGANDESANALSQAFERLTNLQILTVGFYENNLTDRGAEYFANGLSKMRSLQSLRINICGGKKRLSDHGLKCIANAIGCISELTAVTLSFYE